MAAQSTEENTVMGGLQRGCGGFTDVKSMGVQGLKVLERRHTWEGHGGGEGVADRGHRGAGEGTGVRLLCEGKL